MELKVLDRLRWVKRFLAHTPASGQVKADLLAKATDPKQSRWNEGDSFAEARNAHYTNTPAELSKALEGDYNFLEGDVWLEGIARRIPGLDRFREPIMAHEPNNVTGLTLKEWLKVGVASGKGLKLDIKQSAALPKVVEAVKDAKVPQERLIINADMEFGPGIPHDLKFRIFDKISDFKTEVDEMVEVRKALPKATIAVGLYTGPKPAGTVYAPSQIYGAIAIAQQLGGPITFPLRADFVTKELVNVLKEHGTVSVWNDPKTYLPDDLDEAERNLRAMGVDGMIDLREMERPQPVAREVDENGWQPPEPETRANDSKPPPSPWAHPL